MFSVKKPAFITILVVLLVLAGYLNHYLTQKSAIKSSNEYQKYEEEKLAEENEKNSLQTISEEKVQVVESENPADLIEDTNKNIEESLTEEVSAQKSNYFVEYRLSRDKMRAGLIDKLNDIVNNEKTKAETRDEAQKEIMRIGALSENELYIEGLIKAKGFDDALVFLKEDSAKVVVSAKELTEQDVVKILEIIKSETNLDSDKIKIMKKA
ncbi:MULTISPECIES: SpoIIIAH-like family protein [Tissierellales]|uniref:SpoIIIAH-like family protein n=1 Tax=Acidilutibacter cellobiosedens TaxID=2507161 RepID=A0A410QD72_9FIRM|nr:MULTISPECIES: SpoIIIAH-like family protein [Tissierellales]MBE6082592.1 SpoIIIAH-like family protein [Tissierellaceae bacterium]QAT61768.1 SpoIIIAH-like family protein [Acidilutibacter cellobiosedens]SCL82334.1 SpoIIIAH-like protein [Sporanaerobacter sp. PP17-6a]